MLRHPPQHTQGVSLDQLAVVDRDGPDLVSSHDVDVSTRDDFTHLVVFSHAYRIPVKYSWCVAFPLCGCTMPCIYLHEPVTGDVVKAIDDATGTSSVTALVKNEWDDFYASRPISSHLCTHCGQRLARFMMVAGKIEWLSTCFICRENHESTNS